MLIKKNKFRKDRALLQNTWNLKKSPFNKRKYKPGIHKGGNNTGTTYRGLLLQKQRLRAFYFNLKDRQLKNILAESIKHKNYCELVIKRLESRLDTVLFRAGFVITFSMARQFINHRQIFVNGHVVSSPSYTVRNGDKVSIKQNIAQLVKENILKVGRKIPNHIVITKDSCSIVFVENSLPKQESELDMYATFNVGDIVRYYRL